MGYAAGTKQNPTYHNMGDHAECTEIEFCPEEISYAELLDKFFEWHNAFRKPYARQYMSAILYHSQEQKMAIEQAISARETAKKKCRTEVQAYREMTWAEDYHQKYYLRRNKKVALALKARFPVYEDFVNSTAVARANAALGGYWAPDEAALKSLGFESESIEQLMSRQRSLLGRFLKALN